MPAAKEKPKQEAPQEQAPTLDDRVARLEAAVGAALGVTLPDYDDELVVRAREAAAAEAAVKAQALIEKAVADAVKPLSAGERMDRIERIVAHSLNIDLDQ